MYSYQKQSTNMSKQQNKPLGKHRMLSSHSDTSYNDTLSSYDAMLTSGKHRISSHSNTSDSGTSYNDTLSPYDAMLTSGKHRIA